MKNPFRTRYRVVEHDPAKCAWHFHIEVKYLGFLWWMDHHRATDTWDTLAEALARIEVLRNPPKSTYPKIHEVP